jgi:hypothetical protein
MKKLWQHMRHLWPRWTLLPPVPFLLLSLVDGVRGELRWEHIALVLVVIGLAYTNAKTRKLCLGLYPMGLVALLYDSMRFVKDVGVDASSVHLCDLRAVELRWFGVTQGGVRMTLHDLFQQQVHPVLDVICAIPYGTFLFYCIAFATFLYFRDFRAMQRFTWGWLLLNVAGFTTYHLYAAAPPWYFHSHGCTVDMLAHASEGANLARVDAMFGMTYFHAMYGRASDVFGAMPSLHVAYPLFVVLEGWPLLRLPGRTFVVSFLVLMCFAAVYLDHHWVVDVVVGLTYSVASFALIRVVSNFRRQEDALVPAEGSVRS